MTNNIIKGYDEMTGLYTSRYYAKKNACSYEVVVKVDGGYKIMDAADCRTWKNQK